MHAIGAGQERSRKRDCLRARMRAGLLAVFMASVGSALLATVPARAQEIAGLTETAEASDDAEPLRIDEIAKRHDALLEELRTNEQALAAARDSAKRAHLEQVREALLGIDALLRQQVELARSLAAPEVDASNLPEIDLPSSIALDQLYEAQFAGEQQKSRRAAALAASRDAFATAKEKFEKAERERREARTEFEAATPKAERPSAERRIGFRDGPIRPPDSWKKSRLSR